MTAVHDTHPLHGARGHGQNAVRQVYAHATTARAEAEQAQADREQAELDAADGYQGTGDCLCRHPHRGPMYWDWRCMKCSGTILGFFERRARRKAAGLGRRDNP